MKRLLLVALMILVSLVGMVGFSRDAESQNDTPTMSAISNAVSALQATAKATNGAVTQPPATVNAGTEYNWTAYYYPNNGAVTEPPATVNAGVPAKPRMYYLTVTGFTGGDAITACDSGFHLASISEIQNPSDLQYANRSTTAYDDEGFVPPSDHMGWVRTDSFPLVGVPDYCDFRMSSSDQQSGTTMSRRTLWHHPSTELHASAAPSWWYTTQVSISQPESVWCVGDPD